MSSHVQEKDRGIEGGSARWFAVSLLQAWRTQLQGLTAVVAGSWPILLLAIFTPTLRLPYIVVLGSWTILTSAALRKYDIDIGEFANEVTGTHPHSTYDIRGRAAYLYYLGAAGLTGFFLTAEIASVLVAAATSLLAAAWLVSASLVVTPFLLMAFEIYLNRRRDASIVIGGVNLAA